MPTKNILTYEHVKNILNNQAAIINWNPLKRCILMLILACSQIAQWGIWKLYILFHPEQHKFVNIELVLFQFKINVVTILILLGLIYPCYKLQHSKRAQKILPYICVGFFATTLCRDAYLVGIFSPASTAIAMCVVALGLILFNRWVVYFAFIPSILGLGVIMLLSLQQQLPYAPIFNFEAMGYKPYTNSLWLGSMIFFIGPTIFTDLILIEIILKQWRRREQVYQKLSEIDPLTNVLNRRSIHQHLLEMENEIQHTQEQYGIIILDLDFFKAINDTYGHLKGDEILKLTADTLKQNIRPNDVIGRYGGEEFIIIVNNANATFTQYIAERCRQALLDLEIKTQYYQTISISASFGLSLFNRHTSIQHALHQADIAMYRAKQAGRNTVMLSTG